MHAIVRRYIKTAIIFLGIGLAIGGWMIVRRELFDIYPAPYTVSAHTHAVFAGFVMMMILGVALWMFPRPAKDDATYSPRLIRTAYWVLTIATAVRVAGELLRTTSSAALVRWAVILSGLAQIAGIGLFFYTMWSRIRPTGSRAREMKGERF